MGLMEVDSVHMHGMYDYTMTWTAFIDAISILYIINRGYLYNGL